MDVPVEKRDIFESEHFPPGTVQLGLGQGNQLILKPTPSVDPNDPLNWSGRRKWQQIVILCFYTLLVDSCLTVATPMWAVMTAENPESFSALNLNNSYAAGTAALAVGCPLFVPFALRYGRRPVYLFTSAVIVGMAAWSAKMTTAGELFATQVLMNLVGVVNQTLFGLSIADMFFVHQRGTLNGVYFAMTVIGNFFAPVAAGYISTAEGWRWTYWWTAIFSGIITVTMVLFLEETKYTMTTTVAVNNATGTRHHQGPDERHKADTEQENATSQEIHHHLDRSIPMKSKWSRLALVHHDASQQSWSTFAQHFWLPFAITCTIPAVMFCAVMYGFGFSCLSVVLVTQAEMYPEPPYNFSPVGVGNVIVAPAIGGILGCIAGGVATDWLIMKLAARREGIYEPEMRLYLFALPALALPAGLLLYGLTIAKGMHWIINCIGAAFVMFAISGCSTIAITYIQDSYLQILGDSLIGVSFFRNVMATVMVFALPPWIKGMGVYNTFILLGCLAVTINGLVILFLIWGKYWRIKTKERYNRYAQKQVEIRAG